MPAASPCAAVVDCGTPAVANNGQDMVDTFSRVVDVCIVHDLPLKRWVHGRVEKQLRQRVVIRVKKRARERRTGKLGEAGSGERSGVRRPSHCTIEAHPRWKWVAKPMSHNDASASHRGASSLMRRSCKALRPTSCANASKSRKRGKKAVYRRRAPPLVAVPDRPTDAYTSGIPRSLIQKFSVGSSSL